MTAGTRGRIHYLICLALCLLYESLWCAPQNSKPRPATQQFVEDMLAYYTIQFSIHKNIFDKMIEL